MTLKKVEFAQPAGTYCNIDERYTQSTPSYATIAYNATAMPFCDGNDFYGHLLRDEEATPASSTRRRGSSTASRRSSPRVRVR